MKKKYFLALVVFLIPIYLFFSPPVDRDGGPMLAYNFLFFYPLLILCFLISIGLIISSINNIKVNKKESLIILFSTLPTIFLFSLVIIHIINF